MGDDDDRTQEALRRIQRSVQLHARGFMVDRELANDVIAVIADSEEADRSSLIGTAATLLPEPTLHAVEYFCGQILAPGAEWLPISLSRWAVENRERLLPACRHVAIEFRRQLQRE